MKKNYLLFSFLSIILINAAHSQILWQDDFESYEIGPFTDQNNWEIEAEDAEWIQITIIDDKMGNSLQLNTTFDNGSGTFATHYNFWEKRNPENYFLEMSFHFYTGKKIDEGIGMVVVASTDFDEVFSIGMSGEENSIFILAEELDDALVKEVTPNTWYKIHVCYDSETGDITAQATGGPVIKGLATLKHQPELFDFTSLIESNIGIDNIVVAATNGTGIGITDYNNNTLQAKIYPNPTTTEINIETDNQIDKSILYDFSGKKLREYSNQKQLDIEDLNSGVYFLRIFYDDGSAESHEIVK